MQIIFHNQRMNFQTMALSIHHCFPRIMQHYFIISSILSCITLLSLCTLNLGSAELACDHVITSDHGTLLAKIVKDASSSHDDKCLGQLRLHDPVTREVFCLAREGEMQEVLECQQNTTSTSKFHLSLLQSNLILQHEILLNLKFSNIYKSISQ